MPNITASELKTSTVEATFFIETVGLSIKHDSRREGYISEIIVTEFYYFYHDLKPPIHGCANAIRGYYSMRPIQGSNEHLRASKENSFIHGWDSTIHG